jgi:hypothetical protein
MITRRSILRGLFAAPAVVAASSLMPIRGIVMPPELLLDPYYFRGFYFYSDFYGSLQSQWDELFKTPSVQDGGGTSIRVGLYHPAHTTP